MARAIRERGDDIRDIYAPQVTLPSYMPNQAPDASAKLERILGTVGAVAKSPLVGVALRGGQALKGVYDEAMVKAAADRRAARLAAGDGGGTIEGEQELTAPVDTSRQLTSFEERPAESLPEGRDFSRGLATARGVQFMPASGEAPASPVAAAAARKLEELAPTIDPTGKRFAAQNVMAEMGDESRLEQRQRDLAQGRAPGTILPAAVGTDPEAERSAALFRGAQDARSGGVLQDRLTLNRDEALLAAKKAQDRLPFTQEDTLSPGEAVVPERQFKGADVVAGLQDLVPKAPEPTPGMGGMTLRKAPMSLVNATDEQLATVRGRLAMQGDDPVMQQRLAQIDAELKDREDRKAVENAPISREQIMERARMAATHDEQAKVLRDLERVQAPITSLDDLLSDHPKRVLQNEVVSLFPAAPKKSMEEILAEAEKDRAMAEMYRAKGRGEDLRAPAEAAKAGAAAGKYGAQTKTIDAMRDPTVENMQAKTANLAAGTDKIRAQIAAIKARRAAGAYGGGGGGEKLKDDLAYLKVLQDGQSKDVGDAKVEFDKMDVAAANADKAASDAIAKLRAMGNPGNRPTDPPKGADEKVIIERSKEIAAWELRSQAHAEAKALAEQEVANRDHYRHQRDEAKRVMQDALRSSESKYNPAIEAVKGKINKRMGLSVPAAPTAPTAPPPAAPTPAFTAPTGAALKEGDQYESNGKTYKIVGGKPQRIK